MSTVQHVVKTPSTFKIPGVVLEWECVAVYNTDEEFRSLKIYHPDFPDKYIKIAKKDYGVEVLGPKMHKTWTVSAIDADGTRYTRSFDNAEYARVLSETWTTEGKLEIQTNVSESVEVQS